MTKRSRGFTVFELIFIVILLGLASILFFTQKSSIETIARDDKKKTAINTMYYSLEEVYYPVNGYYPQTISSDNLKSVDPALFTDPDGNKINTEDSTYTYTPTDCENNKCKNYSLKATLQNEADYIKVSKN